MSDDNNINRAFRALGRCLESATTNYKTRTAVHNMNALSDIEVDLEAALKAVRVLMTDQVLT